MEHIKKKFKRIINSFNFAIKKTLLKHQKKTNNIFDKYFNFSIKKTLFKNQKKTNNIFDKYFNFKISNFNKYLISLISLLFIYLFYLSIPALYDKTWVQNTLENKLSDEFNINFSISSDISYEILPTPHFTLKNVKIFNDNLETPKQLSEMKKLKVFISKKNLFSKDRIKINKILIDQANFLLQQSDFEFFNDFFGNEMSQKKIDIKNSNLFYKDKMGETISLVKISKMNLFYNKLELSNAAVINGNIFNIPFIFEFNKDFLNDNSYFSVKIKKLNIQLEDKSSNQDKIINGVNELSVFNSKLITKYRFEHNLLSFQSEKSKLINNKINHNGKINFNPFDLSININLEKIKLKKLLNTNSILFDFLKSGNLFNDNLSANILINSSKISDSNFFDSLNLFFNINNGIINLNETEFLSKKIGLLKLTNSRLVFQDESLIFISDFNFNLKDSNNFYSFFQTSKKLRKELNNIFFNLEFDISNEKLTINQIKLDEKKPSPNAISLLNDFNNNNKKNVKNLIEFKNLVNQFFLSYEG